MTISNRVQAYTLKVTAGTESTSPASEQIDLGWCFLHMVECMVPPGHNGYTGFNVQWNGLCIVPFTAAPSFIIANDETLPLDVDTEVDSFLQVNGYNTDQWDHSFYFRFFYTPIALMTPDIEASAWKAIYA